MLPARSTIAAVSSPPGGGERAVIRLSGPRARELTESACTRDGAPLALARRGAVRARLFDGAGHQPVVVLWMPGPGSSTGEDVAEWHVAGSPPLVRAALERALALGAELAAPGEFTRRAFENGRVDLSRAEGVLALVHARSEAQRRSATALLLGGLSERTRGLRESLEELRALCEASLDFEEADTGGVPRRELVQRAAGVQREIGRALAWEEARDAPSGQPRAALVGRPNAGKSSLFNALTQGAALVSEHAGTTRDALHGSWRAGSHAIDLWDLAGTDLQGAAAGLSDRRARELAREVRTGADLWVWVVDASEPDFDLAPELESLEGGSAAPPVVLVLHKQDRADGPRAAAWEERSSAARPAAVRAVVRASSLSGAGLAELSAAADGLLSGAAAGEIRELSSRHRAALESARGCLDDALALLSSGAGLDVAADLLRRATDELDRIEGRTTPEDLLDRIFARFCLGK